MFKNIASQKIGLYAFDSTTGLPKIGDAANITAYVSKDWSTVTALADTSAIELNSTNCKGIYVFDVAQAETNADALQFSGKSTTANIVVNPVLIYTNPAGFIDAAATRAALGIASANLDVQFASIPTANAVADATLDRANAIETGFTLRNAMRIVLAALGGKATGMSTNTVIIRNVTDTKPRITATVDASGNRGAVTLDGN